MEIKEKEEILLNLTKFLEDNDINEANMDDNMEKVEDYLTQNHLGMFSFVPKIYEVAYFPITGERRIIVGKIHCYTNNKWGLTVNDFELVPVKENKNLGYKRIIKENKQKGFSKLVNK